MSKEMFNKIKKHLLAKQAMEAMIAKDFDKAIQLYSSSVDLDPKEWKTYIQRCNCYQKINRLDDALKDAEMVIALNAIQISGHYRKGCILLEKKQFRSAEMSFKMALNCDPNDENSQQQLKQTHRLFLKEFGFDGKDVDTLLAKYDNCIAISDDLISGKLMSVITDLSIEDSRVMVDESTLKTNDSIGICNLSLLNGSLPDFNLSNTSFDSNTNDNEIRKPKTTPLFRKSVTPKLEDSFEIQPINDINDEPNQPTPKSRMVKTRPQILRSVRT